MPPFESTSQERHCLVKIMIVQEQQSWGRGSRTTVQGFPKDHGLRITQIEKRNKPPFSLSRHKNK